MLQTKNQQQPKVDQLQEVAVYLRRADSLVKNGNYEQALEEIQRARTCNPKNLYALAYEERVRSILSAQKNKGTASSTPPADDLEKISGRAIAEAQRSADVAAKRQQRFEKIKQEEEESKKREEKQREAIRRKVYDLLLKAREYHSRKEYNRALDEVTRIQMIDPSNANASELEERIRADQDAELQAAEEARKRQKEEEEKRRKEYMKAELERIKREEEKQKQAEEEARLKAQQEKIKQHLKRAREFCNNGYLDDARGELAFVVVIDPLNEEVLELEQRIADSEEELQAAELERIEAERNKSESTKKQTESQIQQYIKDAKSYLDQNKFSDALKVISSAYVIDPLNEALQQCEEEIIKARDEYIQIEEHKRREEEEKERRQQEEEMRALIQNAQARARAGAGAKQEEKQREAKQRIALYLKQARQYLENEQFESALGEIALAFVVDPFDEDISKLEQQIIDTQNRRRESTEKAKQKTEIKQKEEIKVEAQAGNQGLGKKEETQKLKQKEVTKEQIQRVNQKEELPEQQESFEAERAEQAKRHIAEARRYKKLKEYHKARNELTKAFMLDPLNEELNVFEEELQQEYTKQQEEAKRIKSTRAYGNRAKQYLAQENFAKALEELDTGLKANPDDHELLELKKRIQEAEKRWREVEELWEKVSSTDKKSMRSGNPNSKNQYKEALANYYAKLEESGVKAKQNGQNGNGVNSKSNGKAKPEPIVKKQSEPEIVDIEEEIRKVYESWRQEQQQIERGEREAKIQEHIKRSKKHLKNEEYDKALAEIAFAKMVEENRKDLANLENEIWKIWNEKSKINGGSVHNGENGEFSSPEERDFSLRIHLRAAEDFIEKKEYGKALDEITKAYVIDPLHSEVSRLEERIRHLQAKSSSSKQLKLIYPSAKVVGGY